MNNYKVKQEDLIGELEGFPIEVVQKMVNEQVKQGNKADVSVFREYLCADNEEGGFYWSDSDDGHLFWEQIIEDGDFEHFFSKYPRSLEKAFSDHFEKTPPEVIKENWEKSKERFPEIDCEEYDEDETETYDDICTPIPRGL